MDVRYVVAALAAVLLVSVVGIIVLAFNGQAIPDVLQNIAVGSLTALAGVLVPVTGSPPATRQGVIWDRNEP